MSKPKCPFCNDTGYLRSGCTKVPCARCFAFAKETARIQRKIVKERAKKLQSIDRRIPK